MRHCGQEMQWGGEGRRWGRGGAGRGGAGRGGDGVGAAMGAGRGGAQGPALRLSGAFDLRCATERERCVELTKLHHIARQVSLRQIGVNAGWVEARQFTQLK